MPMADGLLRLAEETAERGSGSRTLKRRAVSTAYYAVFHAIASLCANEILPREKDKGSAEFERVYRALEHGSLKSEFQKAPLKDNARLKAIGALVLRLQSERHRSDYLPTQRLYTTKTCAEHLESARLAMTLLKGLDEQDRRTLAVSLLFKNRPS
ncbi:MAG: hypothetical protein HYS06_10250 [Methylocystis sp.]|nr:hypothetical protein [Methylocystis sp.]